MAEGAQAPVRGSGADRRVLDHDASQHELQFYRGVIEEPVEKLAAKVGILTSLLASRLEEVEPSEAKALIAPLGELSRR